MKAITDSFLSQIFSSSVLTLAVSPDFKVVSRLWVSGSIAVLVVESLGCCLTEGTLARIGRLNNLWAGYSQFSSGWEFRNSISKKWTSFANFAFLNVRLTVCVVCIASIWLVKIRNIGSTFKIPAFRKRFEIYSWIRDHSQ